MRKVVYLMKIKRVAVLPDIHFPYQDDKALNAVLKYLGDHEWDEVVLLGDLLDFDQISDHNKRRLKSLCRPLEDDYKLANEFLDRLGMEVVAYKRTLLEGNHEDRVTRYVEANPAMKGMVEVPFGLHLKDRGIKWVQSWSKSEVHQIGKANFIHGFYHSDSHAKTHVLAFEENVFYGHLHDFQQYSKRSRGNNKTKVGQSLGCLCDYEQYYMKNRPSRWQQGVSTFFFKPDGYFSYYISMIFNGEFISPEGKLYKG